MSSHIPPRGPSVEGLPTVEHVAPETRVAVRDVTPGSIAADLDLRPGDVIEEIDGEPIRDAIDYRFHIASDQIEMSIRRGEEVSLYDIEKDADEDLGILLEDMPILKCNNKCVFCFLHQMPKGMRKSLYYQDDDYRLSFLHGAYVTLTNLSEAEMERIVNQRLSPMYISVHATDPGTRGHLLGRSGPVSVLDRISYLGENGIHMHAQVVLCPGINDGGTLKETVFDLAGHHPHVESVGIVPLGLTRFRKNLPELDPVTPDVARECLNNVDLWQETLRKRLGTRFVYAGDEFYLQSGRQIPPMENYEGFPLLENGVGMVRRFVDVFEEGLPTLKPLDLGHTALVTSVLSGGIVRSMVDRVPGEHPTVVEVRNRFFGDGITVTGLLTGGDVVHAIQADHAGPFDRILLPPNCVSFQGIFLDDMGPAEMSEILGCSVHIGSYDLIETLLASTPENLDRWGETPGSPHPYLSSRQVSD